MPCCAASRPLQRRCSAPGSAAEAGDRGRLALHNGRYIVCVITADGQRTTVTKGLRVPVTDVHGHPLVGASYQDALAQVRRRAMLMWNQLDTSKRPRFAVDGTN